ncbi:MAG: OmpL47-type beta-barrel domain-containing protein [Alkalispirochaeta sp.]
MRRLPAILLCTLVGLGVTHAQEARIYTEDGITYAPSTARFELTPEETSDSAEGAPEVVEIVYHINGGEPQTYEEPLHFPEEGRYELTYTAVNSSGVRSEEERYEVVIDDTAPAVTATARGDVVVEGDITYLRSDTELILRGTDSASGLDALFISLDNEHFVEYTGPTSFPGEGRYRGYAYAVDNVGNRSPTVALSAVVDDTDPSVRIIPRRPTATVRGTRFVTVGTAFAVHAEDDGSGVSRAEVSVDGTGFEEYTEPITIEELGEHSIEARAVDRAGNESEIAHLTFLVDDALPQPSVETLID